MRHRKCTQCSCILDINRPKSELQWDLPMVIFIHLSWHADSADVANQLLCIFEMTN